MEQTKNFGFSFLDDFREPIIQIQGVGMETRNSREYYWDNRNREQGYLFQYTLSGSGSLESDGERHTIGEGEAFFIKFPGKEKYYFQEGENKEWTFLFLLLKGTAADLYYQRIVENKGNILSLEKSANSIKELQRIYQNAAKGTITTPYTASALAFHFLNELCIDLLENTTGYSRLTRAAVRLMEEEYDTLEGVDETARKLGVSASHLSRTFHEETGETVVV